MSNDSERLEVLIHLADAKRMGCRSCSAKVQSRVNSKGELVWRIGLGPWRDNLRDSIDAYQHRLSIKIPNGGHGERTTL